ncbi:hypothetical protein BH10BAC3_BH10BAC3_18410 [soil metagenome]
MKNIVYLLLVAVIALSACRKIVVDNNGTVVNPIPPPTGGQTITLKGKITADTTLKAINTYILEGLVYIRNNATITIEAGTTIKGSFLDPIGGLVITKGAKIIAKGTADKPIVFTSNSPSPRSGDWAGIVLLGKAPTNSSFNGTAGQGSIEGGINNADGDGLYGGADENDNSGAMTYIRIEYAGFAFLPDNEINSLTMGGIGRGTQIDHIQVTYAKDDAYEWFGGTVDCKYLISYKTQDDDFDTDNGFSGRVQFGLIVRDSLIADISKSEAFESDNDANGSSLTPKTSAVFSNVTALGPLATLDNKGSDLFLAGAQIRRNSSISIFNSAIIGWPVGLLIDAGKGKATDLNIEDSTLRVRNTIIAGCKVPVNYVANGTPTGATPASINTWFTTSIGNAILGTVNEAKLVNPFNRENFDPTPFSTSPLSTGGAFTDPKLDNDGFTKVTFRGAIPPSGADANWWKGWTTFN